MDNAVTQEVFKRIDALAEKLGTTAAYLWPKLVAWEFGKAIGGILASTMFTILGLLVFWKFFPLCRKEWDTFDHEGLIFTYGVICLASGVAFVLGAVSFIFQSDTWAATLISPEAAAFYKLVGR